MSNRDDVKLIDIVPENLRDDEEIQRVSEVAQTQLDEINEAIPTLQLYANIDLLPEPILRMLAVENRVYKYEWQLAQTIEEKRELIKNSFTLNQRRGTGWAVERVFNLIGINANLQEWFDYGGAPYTFKIDITDTTGRTIDSKTQETIFRLVDHYKPLRSSYELTIAVNAEGELGFQGAGRMANYRRVTFQEAPSTGRLGFQGYIRSVNYLRLNTEEA